MGETELETEACADITQSGHAVGTPTYMSPEQVSGSAVDARSDVYSLGTLLYEMLTLEPPFRGSLVGVMSAHLNDAPKAPRARAPKRNIPLELEKACLRALAKSPADRHQSARELHDEIQTWLEAAADKTQRFDRARELASQGKTLLDDYNSLRKQIADADRQIEDVRQRFDAWQSVDEKSELFAAEDEAAGLRRKLSERASEVVMTLSAALGQDQEHAEARRLMADFYWERFLEAESRHDLEGRDFFEKLLRSFRDGRYEKELEGVGSIRLTSTPPGATVTLHRLEERNVVSIPTERTELGLTPVTATPVPMASYLATLAKEGHQETRYPIWISRNQRWEGSVKLFKKDAIPPGFVHIPAGPFVAGGDDELRGWSLPASRPTLDDFFISVHPVTLREYLEFLEDLRADGQRTSAEASPETKPGRRVLFQLWRGRPFESPSRGRPFEVAFGASRGLDLLARQRRVLRVALESRWFPLSSAERARVGKSRARSRRALVPMGKSFRSQLVQYGELPQKGSVDAAARRLPFGPLHLRRAWRGRQRTGLDGNRSGQSGSGRARLAHRARRRLQSSGRHHAHR